MEKPTLTEEEMGKIALAVLREQIRKDGVRLNDGLKREIGAQAKKMDIPLDKAMAFIERLVREAVDDVFGKN